MPVIETRDADPNEYELPPISVPATGAGVRYELPDLSTLRGRGGLVYVAMGVTNGSADFLTLHDSNGRACPVLGGQAFEWALPHGVPYVALTPNSATLAGQVTLVLRVRRLADG